LLFKQIGIDGDNNVLVYKIFTFYVILTLKGLQKLPTVFIEGPYRFYFFSREETRKHVHVASSDGEVKIWLEPEISVAKVVNLSNTEVNTILEIVKKRKEDIDADWNKHFGCN